MLEFQGFPKIPRLSRDVVITEKIDGTNACIAIFQVDAVAEEYANLTAPFFEITQDNIDYIMLAGSRNKWIGEQEDNYGFAEWVSKHPNELMQLGEGRHYGEWWGQGIQRGYGLKEKRFSLFNTSRWGVGGDIRPSCCSVVPVLYEGLFDTSRVARELGFLAELGSQAAPGFMQPEGIVVFHKAGNLMFKKTIKNDEKPKGSKEAS